MALTIANLYPLLTTAEGDEGNARVLRHRAGLRGIAAQVITVHSGVPPYADFYLLGGRSHVDPDRLVALLRFGDALATAVKAGSVLFAAGAGYEVLGEWFTTADGERHAGLGLLDARFAHGPQAVGPVATLANAELGLPPMSGYESHHGRAMLGPDAVPLARLEFGVGNGGTPAADGAVRGRVIGTYLHGPVLARNPELADLLLGWRVRMLAPAPPGSAALVRSQRLAEDRLDRSGWAGHHR